MPFEIGNFPANLIWLFQRVADFLLPTEKTVWQHFRDDPVIATATATIALFTVIMAVLQWREHQFQKRVNRANYQLALFEKRMAVYFSVERFLHKVSQTGKPSIDEASKMRYDVRNAAFLFPNDVLEYAEGLFKKSNEHNLYENLSEPLRQRNDLNDNEAQQLKEYMENQIAMSYG